MPRGGATAEIGPGAVFGGRYRFERLLGTGGMASVWLARDSRLGRLVAVKVLSEVLALDGEYVRRFRREARIAAGLSHPNLVRVFDFGSEGERPYLAMEYIESGTLAEQEPQSVEARTLALQLLGALDHIHSAGVVHRDVKPANVLIDSGGRARLTDFGIAQPEDATQLTLTGQVIGTLRYMAPEVRDGSPATERSDLYSCGAVLEERLPPSPPPELAELVESLTQSDPARRPASAATALSPLGNGEEHGTDAAVTEPVATERIATTAQHPASGAPAVGGRERELRVDIAKAVTALASLGALALLLVLLLGGGDGSSDRNAGRSKPAQEVKTTTTTTTAPAPAPTTVPAAPTPEAKPAKPEKAPKVKPSEGTGPGGSGPPGQKGKAFEEGGGSGEGGSGD
jgi:eukaryotic-like serine/threonine-protein kinase